MRLHPERANAMTIKLPFYFDHAATTPCDPRVVEAMLPYFTERYGNPGSRNHSFGWEAGRAGVDEVREQVAALLVDEKEVIFTSGVMESSNLVIRGRGADVREVPAGSGKSRAGHVVTGASSTRRCWIRASVCRRRGSMRRSSSRRRTGSTRRRW